jgi:predicted transcriptional regulator
MSKQSRVQEKPDLAPEITLSFEKASDLVRVLSVERIRLLKAARQQPAGISELARRLKRDPRAVSRDVDLLEQFKLLKTSYEANLGHGRRRIVEPLAAKLRLVAII